MTAQSLDIAHLRIVQPTENPKVAQKKLRTLKHERTMDVDRDRWTGSTRRKTNAI